MFTASPPPSKTQQQTLPMSQESQSSLDPKSAGTIISENPVPRAVSNAFLIFAKYLVVMWLFRVVNKSLFTLGRFLPGDLRNVLHLSLVQSHWVCWGDLQPYRWGVTFRSMDDLKPSASAKSLHPGLTTRGTPITGIPYKVTSLVDSSLSVVVHAHTASGQGLVVLYMLSRIFLRSEWFTSGMILSLEWNVSTERTVLCDTGLTGFVAAVWTGDGRLSRNSSGFETLEKTKESKANSIELKIHSSSMC